jgi:DNA-binding MarR family transcriptional regulator
VTRSKGRGDKQAEVVARSINSGAIHLLRGMREVDRQAGLTPARLSALSVVVFGGPRTLGRLAEIEGVAGPTMTRIVDGLSDLGLVARRPHPDSARSVRIVATAEGEALMHVAAGRRVETIVAAMTTLGASDQRRLAAAAPLLERLAAAVRDEQRTPSSFDELTAWAGSPERPSPYRKKDASRG